MNNNQQDNRWSESSAPGHLQSKNVILVDADYVDQVAFNLIVNFERMLDRRIPKASMALWADCVALDGGLRQGDNQTQVILIHSKSKQQMDNFDPSNFADELTNKAFRDHLGEFVFDAYAAEEGIVSYGDFFVDALQLITTQKEVKRVMVIPNAEDAYIYNKVRDTLHRLDDTEKHITVFAMQPMPGGNFRQEILGFSLMAALKIKSEEINKKTNK